MSLSTQQPGTPPRGGTLYVVGTPIGNLEDLSFRALRILKEVDLIACEDTRHTARLLAHYGIATPRRSYHEHNEAARATELLKVLNQGRSIALVSDAGMPLISDPGYDLVSACRDAGIEVIPVPGPSAVVTALAGSGLPSDSFLFAGFLPSRSTQRRKRLQEIARAGVTIVLYEAPHRLVQSLQDMSEILGPRRACVARELTKVHEEWIRGTLPEIVGILQSRPVIRGEITVIVEGGESPIAARQYPDSLREHLDQEMARTGCPRNEALKSVARQRGISRKEAYRLLLEEDRA